jgi:hypothetical protein
MSTDRTMRIFKLINHDQQFEDNLNKFGSDPVILDHLDFSEPNYTEKLQKLIFADGAGADFIAKCQCGLLEGNNKIGMRCEVCQTDVCPTHLLDSNNLMCKNWLSCPQEIPNGWLTPRVYLILSHWLSYTTTGKVKMNYLDDILDVTTPIPFELSDVVQGKGFVYLYDHFDRLMEYFTQSHPVISKKADTKAIRFFLAVNRDKIFCHTIPIMNGAINPIITSDTTGPNKRQYSSTTADFALKAAITLSKHRHSTRKTNRVFRAERNALKAFRDIIAYTEDATRKYISVKKAIPRTHIFGSRFHLSFRAVIVPIVGIHTYHELHVPWRLAVNTLRVHLIGMLCRSGLSPNDAITKVRRALQIVDPDIAALFKQMIADSPFPGIPCLWDRPPSIRDGSVTLKFWTKIDEDLSNSCVGVSPLDVALSNADFDGDALAGILVPETDMVMAMENLSPEHLIFNRNTAEISDEIAINKTTSMTWNAFLESV